MRRLPFFCLSLGAILMSWMAPAQAAVKVAQVVVMAQALPADALKKMPAQQRTMMRRAIGRTFSYTTYVDGGKTRTDKPNFRWLADTAGDGILAVDPSSRTYSLITIDRLKAGLAGVRIDATLTPTGKTQTILGHRCRDYRVASPTGASDRLTGDLWVAEDLPRMAAPLPEGPLGPFLAKHWKSVHGMPLKADMTLDRRQYRALLTLKTSAVSNVDVPESFFAIPKGFRRSAK